MEFLYFLGTLPVGNSIYLRHSRTASYEKLSHEHTLHTFFEPHSKTALCHYNTFSYLMQPCLYQPQLPHATASLLPHSHLVVHSK